MTGRSVVLLSHFRITGRLVKTVGLTLAASARMALHRMPWLALTLAVASTRAKPLGPSSVRFRPLSHEKAAIGCVTKITVVPGATASELKDASLRGPVAPNTSTPMITSELSVFVQVIAVPR
jgi:hypothetical protein